MKRSKRILISILLILLVAVAAFFLSQYKSSVPRSISISGQDKVSVKDGFSLKGLYTDSLGNEYNYSFSLPEVKGETDYIREVRRDIDSVYEKYLSPTLDTMDKGYSLSTIRCVWESAEYDGITSVLIRLDSDWGESDFHIYNFDMSGNKVENVEILKTVGLDEDVFVKTVKRVLSEYMDSSVVLDGRSQEMKDFFAKQRERTLSGDNCTSSLPLYLNAEGNISFVTKVYSVAGADYYYRIFKI